MIEKNEKYDFQKNSIFSIFFALYLYEDSIDPDGCSTKRYYITTPRDHFGIFTISFFFVEKIEKETLKNCGKFFSIFSFFDVRSSMVEPLLLLST